MDYDGLLCGSIMTFDMDSVFFLRSEFLKHGKGKSAVNGQASIGQCQTCGVLTGRQHSPARMGRFLIESTVEDQ